MLDQPLDALIKKKKKVDTLAKKKTPKVGGIPTTPKTGKKLNKPEGKGIVKTPKKVEGSQKSRGGAALVKGGKGAVAKTTTGRATPVTTKATPRGANVPARGGATVKGGAVRGGPKGNTRGGIRNNVMTTPKQEFTQPTRQQTQTQRGGRGGFTPNTVNRTTFKKKAAPFSAGNIPQNMSISFRNDQYQEQQQFQQPQQHADTEENFRSNNRALNQKPIEFEEIDSSGTHKLKTLDSIFKSINSTSKQNL
jgi:hypothetical protein